MNQNLFRLLSVIFVFNLGLLSAGYADEVQDAQGSEESDPQKPTRKPKGRVKREREAEGTQAQNQFDSDIITKKSEYKYNGKQLEVDPD